MVSDFMCIKGNCDKGFSGLSHLPPVPHICVSEFGSFEHVPIYHFHPLITFLVAMIRFTRQKYASYGAVWGLFQFVIFHTNYLSSGQSNIIEIFISSSGGVLCHGYHKMNLVLLGFLFCFKKHQHISTFHIIVHLTEMARGV